MNAIRKASRWVIGDAKKKKNINNDDSIDEVTSDEADEYLTKQSDDIESELDEDNNNIVPTKSNNQNDVEPSPAEPVVQALLELGNNTSKGKKSKRKTTKKPLKRKSDDDDDIIPSLTEQSIIDDTDSVHHDTSPPPAYSDHVESDVMQYVGGSLDQNNKKRKVNTFDDSNIAFEGILGNPTWEKFLNDDIGEPNQSQSDEYNIFLQQQQAQVQQEIQRAVVAVTKKKRKTANKQSTNPSSNVDPALEHLDDSTHTEQHYKEQQLVEQAMLQASAIASSLESNVANDGHDVVTTDSLHLHSIEHIHRKHPDQGNDNQLHDWAMDPNHASIPIITNRGGSFTKEEIETLDRFMNHYMAAKNMTREELCERVWASQRKKDNFWDLAASALPHRTRSSVYKHVRRTYHVFEARGKWDKETDVQLEALVTERGAQWKSIGITLGRMPEDCRDRWRNYLKCGTERHQNKWTIEEENQLKRIVNDILHSDGTGDINWTVVSDKMNGSRSRIQCRYKWNKLSKKLNSLVAESMTDYDRSTIINLLKNYSDESQINWDTIAIIEGKGVYTGKDFMNMYGRLKAEIPNSDNLNYQHVLELIKENLDKDGIDKKQVKNSRAKKGKENLNEDNKDQDKSNIKHELDESQHIEKK